jgi:hypothetical protein
MPRGGPLPRRIFVFKQIKRAIDRMNARYDSLPEPWRAGCFLAVLLPGLIIVNLSIINVEPFIMLGGMGWLILWAAIRSYWLGIITIHTADGEQIRPEPPVNPEEARQFKADLALLGFQELPASLVEFKKVARRRFREVHPDKGGTDAAFCAVFDAYERLVARFEH